MLAYLPYYEQFTIHLFGDVAIHGFGTAVLCAVVVGWVLATRRAVKLGLKPQVMEGAAYWAIVWGFVFGHIFQVLWYRPQAVTEDPLVLVRLWDGLSSYGGFAGAAMGLAVYFYRKKGEKFIDYADALTYGMTPAWIFGRLGCTMAHDHPGVPTDFFLAVDYPAGHHFGAGPRHNLGFYEMLFTIFLTGVIFFLARKPRRAGFLTGALFVLYAPVRFYLDSLRATDLAGSDLRFGGLTPAQWASFVLLAIGVYLIYRALQPGAPVQEFVTPAPEAAGKAGSTPGDKKSPSAKQKKKKKGKAKK